LTYSVLQPATAPIPHNSVSAPFSPFSAQYKSPPNSPYLGQNSAQNKVYIEQMPRRASPPKRSLGQHAQSAPALLPRPAAAAASASHRPPTTPGSCKEITQAGRSVPGGIGSRVLVLDGCHLVRSGHLRTLIVRRNGTFAATHPVSPPPNHVGIGLRSFPLPHSPSPPPPLSHLVHSLSFARSLCAPPIHSPRRALGSGRAAAKFSLELPRAGARQAEGF